MSPASLFYQETILDTSIVTTVEIFPGDGSGIVDVASVQIILIIDGDNLITSDLFVLQCCEPGLCLLKLN